MSDYKPPRCTWITHNNTSKYLAQLAGSSMAIIPDRAFHYPGIETWAPELREVVLHPVVYTRICHGPRPEDTSPAQYSEYVEALAVEHWGAFTDSVAWTSAQGRKLYWYDTSKIDTIAYAGLKFTTLGPALPHVRSIMLDYLTADRLVWQEQFVGDLTRVLSANNQRKWLITNGRPYISQATFNERLRLIYEPNLRRALVESFSYSDDFSVLDCFKVPQHVEQVETICEILLEYQVPPHVCYGRMREDGEATQ